MMTNLDELLRDLCECDEAECGADTTLHLNLDQLQVVLEQWMEQGRLLLGTDIEAMRERERRVTPDQVTALHRQFDARTHGTDNATCLEASPTRPERTIKVKLEYVGRDVPLLTPDPLDG